MITTRAIARVHPVHLMNVDWALGGRQPQIKPVDLGCESAESRLLPFTFTIAIVNITQPVSWYSFYRSADGGRLSRPRQPGIAVKVRSPCPRLYACAKTRKGDAPVVAPTTLRLMLFIIFIFQFRSRRQNWFSQLHFPFQSIKEHCSAVTLNCDRWPRLTNVIWIWPRWTTIPDIWGQRTFISKVIVRKCRHTHTRRWTDYTIRTTTLRWAASLGSEVIVHVITANSTQ